MRTLILGLVLALFVTSCGKDNKGGSGSALSDSQKSQLKEVIASSGRGTFAGMASVPKRAADELSSALKANTKKSDEKTLQMAQRLRDSISSGQCSYSQKQEGNFSNPLNPGDTHSMDFSLNGNQCPIAARVAMKGWITSDNSGAGFDLDLEYLAKDAEFAKLNDVTGFKLGGRFTVTAGNGSAKGEGTMKGTITSTKYGPVGVNLTFDGNATQDGREVTYAAVYSFKDYNAELKVTEKREGNKAHYTYMVNGQTVSKDEFYSYTESNPFLAPTVKY